MLVPLSHRQSALEMPTHTRERRAHRRGRDQFFQPPCLADRTYRLLERPAADRLSFDSRIRRRQHTRTQHATRSARQQQQQHGSNSRPAATRRSLPRFRFRLVPGRIVSYRFASHRFVCLVTRAAETKRIVAREKQRRTHLEQVSPSSGETERCSIPPSVEVFFRCSRS